MKETINIAANIKECEATESVHSENWSKHRSEKEKKEVLYVLMKEWAVINRPIF